MTSSNGTGTTETRIARIATAQPAAIDVDRLTFEPQSWDQLARVAETYAGSGLIPRALSNPAALMLVVVQGRELGLTTLRSIRGIHVIDGKPTLSAELTRELAARAGARVEFPETTSETCTCRVSAADGRTITITWTLKDAQAAGLAGRDPWRKFPAAMLRARASADAIRALIPEALGGLYMDDEVGPVVDVEVVPAKPAPAPSKATQSTARLAEVVSEEPVREAPAEAPKAAPEPAKQEAEEPPASPEMVALDKRWDAACVALKELLGAAKAKDLILGAKLTRKGKITVALRTPVVEALEALAKAEQTKALDAKLVGEQPPAELGAPPAGHRWVRRADGPGWDSEPLPGAAAVDDPF
ncbi:MAG: hypothetical protein RL139_1256 [Gemmatimonadota bacterium]|jgi:hypothetical protein